MLASALGPGAQVTAVSDVAQRPAPQFLRRSGWGRGWALSLHPRRQREVALPRVQGPGSRRRRGSSPPPPWTSAPSGGHGRRVDT